MKKFIQRALSVRGLARRMSKGFTLIELLVVIAIIALLASIILASLNTARSKARDATREQSLQEMAKDIALADTAPAPAITCSASTADASKCTAPTPISFAAYADPLAGDSTTICGATDPAPSGGCQYGIYDASGGAVSGATTENYMICSYLENATTINGTAVVAGGLINVNSNSNTGLQAACPGV